MNLQHNLNNLPVISDYDDLVNFNNSLPSSFQPLNIESVSYAKNIIIANGDSIGIDRFLYNYITSPYRLTGNIVRLKEYDFSKLSLLLHPREFFEEFEAYETAESKFAHSMDNLQPLMLNNSNGGSDWREHGVSATQVHGRQDKTALGSKELFKVVDAIIDANVKAGNIKDE